LRRDRHVVRVPLDLELAIGELGEHAADLRERAPALGAHGRAPGGEEDVLRELDDHAAPHDVHAHASAVDQGAEASERLLVDPVALADLALDRAELVEPLLERLVLAALAVQQRLEALDLRARLVEAVVRLAPERFEHPLVPLERLDPLAELGLHARLLPLDALDLPLQLRLALVRALLERDVLVPRGGERGLVRAPAHAPAR